MSNDPMTSGAVRAAIETTVATGDCSPEGTRRLTRSGPVPARPIDPGRPLPGSFRTLEQVLQRLEQSEPDAFTAMPERVGLARAICSAVVRAHADELLLRDLKPSLIAIGLLGEVSLIDHPAILRPGATAEPQLPGATPAYMAPEQARQEPVDQRSDQYALGVVLYRLFGLAYPIWDADPEEFWQKKRLGTPNPVPASVRATVPAPLLAICLRAMQAQPGLRYATVAHLALDLQAFAEGRPVTALPEGLASQISRSGRRLGPVLVTASLSMAVAGGLVWWQSDRAAQVQQERSRIAHGSSLGQQHARAEAAIARETILRQQLEDMQTGQGWRPIAAIDFAQPLPPEIEVARVDEFNRVESDVRMSVKQKDGLLAIEPAPQRTFLRWSQGLAEESRIEVDVETTPHGGWNLDLSVAGDTMNGYRLRAFGRDYLCLETTAKGWYETLQRIPPAPLKANRLKLALQHSGGHVLVTIDGRQVISYLDPSPLRGETHRSVSFGRFFETGETLIRRLRIWTRRDARFVSVMEPGLALLRSGHRSEARDWFDRLQAEQESDDLRGEAAFLAATAEPAGPARQQRLERLATTPRHPFAARALDLIVKDAFDAQDWNGAVLAQDRRQRLEERPELLSRLADQLIGRLRTLPLHHDAILAAIGRLPIADLQLSYAGVTELSALGRMRLTACNFTGNRLTDIAPLHGMPLVSLELADNAVREVSPLVGMPLRKLGLSDNPVASLAPLAGLQLTHLDLTGTAVTDLAPLAQANLVHLKISRTSVASLAPLAGQPLAHLELQNTQIADLAPLDLGRLAWLDITRSRIADLAPLAQAGQLRTLRMAGTPVTDLAPLRGLALTELDISGTSVTSLEPLTALPVTQLNLARTALTSLRGLPVARLSYLDLNSCRLSGIGELRGVKLGTLALPLSPFSAEDLAILGSMQVGNVHIDPGDSLHWDAAVAMSEARTINGLPRAQALLAREACLALAHGRPWAVATLAVDGQAVLPMGVAAGSMRQLAALAGGRLPNFADEERRRAHLRLFTRLGWRWETHILAAAVDSTGSLSWDGGRPFTDRRLGLRELKMAAAGGMLAYNIGEGFSVVPADTRSVLILEF